MQMAREDCAAFIARDESRQAVGFLIGRIPVEPNGVAEVFNLGVLALTVNVLGSR